MKRQFLRKIRPYQRAVFKKKNVSSFFIKEDDISLHFKLHMETFMLCQMVLLSNINFLVSKQNKTPKIGSNMLNILLFLDMLCLLYKQSFIIKCKYILETDNKYLYCYKLHWFSGLFQFWYQWYTIVCIGF